uniref:Uncharacterized protein n=1 Tax=Cannabis sativa TaxID=3483 RepID=A0A803PST5_CANSA
MVTTSSPHYLQYLPEMKFHPTLLLLHLQSRFPNTLLLLLVRENPRTLLQSHIREPAFSPFALPTMPRPWTRKAPLKSAKEKKKNQKTPLFESFNLLPPYTKGLSIFKCRVIFHLGVEKRFSGSNWRICRNGV